MTNIPILKYFSSWNLHQKSDWAFEQTLNDKVEDLIMIQVPNTIIEGTMGNFPI